MKKIGVLGGGQLGMMLFEATKDLDVELSFLDPDPACSCRSHTDQVTLGSFKDKETVLEFAKGLDIVTVEIEHVHVDALREIAAKGVQVYPQPELLAMIQDKGDQKDYYEKHGFDTAPYALYDSSAQIDLEAWPLPFVIKSRRDGYDGQGVKIIKSEADLAQGFDVPCLVERMAEIEKELSIIVARNADGEVKTFPAVEMEFDAEANLVSALVSPAAIPESVAKEAADVAMRLVQSMGLVGLLAVEFFWLQDGRLWVNEVAPRPHNSGHQTIEGNITSQYEQHLRAICNLPLGDTCAKGFAAMVNLLGSDGHAGPKLIQGAEAVEQMANAYLHDYHKALTRPKRKMGHITVVHADRDLALAGALRLQQELKYVSQEN